MQKVFGLLGKNANETIIGAKYADSAEGVILENMEPNKNYQVPVAAKSILNAVQVADGAQTSSLGVALAGVSSSGAALGVPLIGVGSYLGASGLLSQLEISFGISVSEYWGETFYDLLNNQCH